MAEIEAPPQPRLALSIDEVVAAIKLKDVDTFLGALPPTRHVDPTDVARLLVEVCKADCIAMARHLVEHFNADFLSSYPTTSAYNALTWAAGYSPDCLLYAINERDIDVNACDPGLRTSLHHAMWYNQSRMVEFLLEKKADPTARSKTGWGPLSFAAQEGHIEAMKAMLDRTTVAVNIVDNSERTALHIAAKYGKAEACRLLVEAKIDVEMKDVQQLSALDVATGDAAKYLFDLCPLDIFQAIKTNRAMTEIVVQRDTALRVDWIRLKNDAGKTPIMYALEEGKHESLELLLEAVPNDMKEEVFENKMNEGATNLFMSAMLKPSCLTAIVKWFNPELELDNEQSVTPLELAASLNKPALLQQLIEFDPPSAAESMPYALRAAITHHAMEAIEWLLKVGGADPNGWLAANDAEETPLMYAAAARGDGVKIGELLFKYGALAYHIKADGNNALCIAAGDYGTPEMCEFLIRQYPYGVRQVNLAGYTCFHIAAESSVDNTLGTMIETLISLGDGNY